MNERHQLSLLCAKLHTMSHTHRTQVSLSSVSSANCCRAYMASTLHGRPLQSSTVLLVWNCRPP